MWHGLVMYYNCEKESELKNGNFGQENIALFLIQGSPSLFLCVCEKGKTEREEDLQLQYQSKGFKLRLCLNVLGNLKTNLFLKGNMLNPREDNFYIYTNRKWIILKDWQFDNYMYIRMCIGMNEMTTSITVKRLL